MRKVEAYRIIEFIEDHFDMVDQEEWFEFCGMVLDLIAHEANDRGPKAARELAEDFPDLFSAEERS